MLHLAFQNTSLFNCISQTIVLFEQNKSLWLTVGKQSASENWSLYQKFSLLVANKDSKRKVHPYADCLNDSFFT